MQGGFNPRLFYFNRAAPGADTDIIASGITNLVDGKSTATSLTPTVDCYFGISVVLATASVFNMTETNSGTTLTYGLEQSQSLSAGDLWTWTEIPVSTECTYNFRVETNGIIRRLLVYELQIGVAS